MNKQFLSEVSTLVALYGEPFKINSANLVSCQFSNYDCLVIVLRTYDIPLRGFCRLRIYNWYVFSNGTGEEFLTVLDLIEEVKLLALKYGIEISESEMET
jgi:hypothetical protein